METLVHLSENHYILPNYALWGSFAIIVFVLLFLDLFVFIAMPPNPT